jgi:hypothetical protein
VDRYLTSEITAFNRFVETKIQLRRSGIFIAIGVPKSDKLRRSAIF